MRVGGATSQLDLSSLTPLPVAVCVRLQLGVPYFGYFSILLQVVDNWSARSVVVDSPLGGSWPWKTLSFFYFPGKNMSISFVDF